MIPQFQGTASATAPPSTGAPSAFVIDTSPWNRRKIKGVVFNEAGSGRGATFPLTRDQKARIICSACMRGP